MSILISLKDTKSMNRKIDNSNDKVALLKSVKLLTELEEADHKIIASCLHRVEIKKGDIVIQEGDTGNCAYIVSAGQFSVEKFNHTLTIFSSGDIFGEVALLDDRPRTASVIAKTDGIIYRLDRSDLENNNIIGAETRAKLYKALIKQITSYLRQGNDLYDEMDVLLIQDGGCAPGYNPVTAFISEYLEKISRRVYVAAEGFKSIVSNQVSDYRCLIYSKERFNQMDHIPGVIFSPPLRSERGAEFRSERYREFKNEPIQKIAAKNIVDRKVKVLIGIGGNGTFAGINALSKLLPKSIQVFFIPVTIDSDVSGTACIGEYTGVEVGAEKIRCYMADARTHNRCYIIEMMGAQGGYHALLACLGAGAHLAVLPSSHYNMKKLVEALNPREETVIVVAEGYQSEKRKAENYQGNAAEYFRDELIGAGLNTKQRVICEPFSRDIRGAAPNNMDIMLAHRMARKLREQVLAGESRVTPAVEADREYSLPFDEIKTDNSVATRLASLANRLY
jgi:6-phosphofructokinase